MFPESVLRRIRPYIHDTDECIDYPSLTTNGYGRITCRINGKTEYHRVHRIVYSFINNVELTSNDHIMHTCDRPSCFNPKHLKKGTHKDNMDDRDSKGRVAQGETHCRYVHGNRSKKVTEPEHKAFIERGFRKDGILTTEQAKQVKILINCNTLTTKRIAAIFNVPIYIIADIKRGRNYKHVSISQ